MPRKNKRAPLEYLPSPAPGGGAIPEDISHNE